MSKSMKHYSEEQKWSLIRSYYDSGQLKDSYKKKSQFFDRRSRREPKNRNFLSKNGKNRPDTGVNRQKLGDSAQIRE